MENFKVNPQNSGIARFFIIPTAPSPADPAWQVSVKEVFLNGFIQEYTDYSVLEELINDLR